MMRGCRGREGFALLAILWTLVFLGVLGAEFYAAGRADRGVVANLRASAQARWAARAGLARTLDELEHQLASAPAGRAFATDAVLLAPPDFERDGVRVGTLVLDARAFLSLNGAEPEELHRLARAVGLEHSQAAAFARAVEAHRRRGDAPVRYHSVDELLEVPGVSPEVYARVAPHLGTAGDGRINANTASVPVLCALLDVEPAVARGIVARRAGSAFANLYELLGMLPRVDRSQLQAEAGRLSERVVFTPREVQVVVAAAREGSPMRIRLEALVLLAGGSHLAVLELIER